MLHPSQLGHCSPLHCLSAIWGVPEMPKNDPFWTLLICLKNLRTPSGILLAKLITNHSSDRTVNGLQIQVCPLRSYKKNYLLKNFSEFKTDYKGVKTAMSVLHPHGMLSKFLDDSCYFNWKCCVTKLLLPVTYLAPHVCPYCMVLAGGEGYQKLVIMLLG